MSTRVLASWNNLLRCVHKPQLADIALFREWLTSDLLNVSRLLLPKYAEKNSNIIWNHLFTAPIATFPVRKVAGQAFFNSLGPEPPTFDPCRLWDWGMSTLWNLLVFIDPDESCPEDQFDLELWWSESSQEAVYECGLSDRLAFRPRTDAQGCRHPCREPLKRWTGDTKDLKPASKMIVRRLVSGATFLD